jgi:predicted nuclease of restriction endonuclease-like RecB superfamily
VLTKDLLINKKRADRIHPHQLDADDDRYLSLAGEMILSYRESVGKSVGELKERIDEISFKQLKIKAGFDKLLFDKCAIAECSEHVERERWELFSRSISLLKSKTCTSIAEFQKTLARQTGELSFEQLSAGLYADLPEYRVVEDVPAWEPADLIHRYNCAQIQGLLLYATRVVITVQKLSLSERRTLFRNLKFHHLLIEQVEESGDKLSFFLSGPLSIFEASQTYSLKIATFLPYLLHLPKFTLEADIKWQNSLYKLCINDKIGIRSHYKEQGSHIPEELTACLAQFNEKYPDFNASTCDDFINLGQQSYCFPDLVVKNNEVSNKNPCCIRIELFHRWHSGQIKSRLSTLKHHAGHDLKIGICRSVAKKTDMRELLDGNLWFQKNGFEFTNFPTSKQIFNLISS